MCVYFALVKNSLSNRVTMRSGRRIRTRRTSVMLPLDTVGIKSTNLRATCIGRGSRACAFICSLTHTRARTYTHTYFTTYPNATMMASNLFHPDEK